jgi:hypothetical protein
MLLEHKFFDFSQNDCLGGHNWGATYAWNASEDQSCAPGLKRQLLGHRIMEISGRPGLSISFFH